MVGAGRSRRLPGELSHYKGQDRPFSQSPHYSSHRLLFLNSPAFRQSGQCHRTGRQVRDGGGGSKGMPSCLEARRIASFPPPPMCCWIREVGQVDHCHPPAPCATAPPWCPRAQCPARGVGPTPPASLPLPPPPLCQPDGARGEQMIQAEGGQRELCMLPGGMQKCCKRGPPTSLQPEDV